MFEMTFDKILAFALTFDIIVHLEKTYYNKDGDEVFDRCKIAKRYLLSR